MMNVVQIRIRNDAVSECIPSVISAARNMNDDGPDHLNEKHEMRRWVKHWKQHRSYETTEREKRHVEGMEGSCAWGYRRHVGMVSLVHKVVKLLHVRYSVRPIKPCFKTEELKHHAKCKPGITVLFDIVVKLASVSLQTLFPTPRNKRRGT
jgi:hypothetical protein